MPYRSSTTTRSMASTRIFVHLSQPGDRQAHRLPVLRVHLTLALGRREGAGAGHALHVAGQIWPPIQLFMVCSGEPGPAAFGHSFPSLVLLLRLDRLQGCSPKARLDANASRTVGQHRVQVWSAVCCCGSIGDIFIIGHELRPRSYTRLGKSQHLRQTRLHSLVLYLNSFRHHKAEHRHQVPVNPKSLSSRSTFLRLTSCAANLQQQVNRCFSPPTSRPDQHGESYVE